MALPVYRFEEGDPSLILYGHLGAEADPTLPKDGTARSIIASGDMRRPFLTREDIEDVAAYHLATTLGYIDDDLVDRIGEYYWDQTLPTLGEIEAVRHNIRQLFKNGRPTKLGPNMMAA